MAKIELPAFIRSMSGTLYKDEKTRVVAKTYRHNGTVETHLYIQKVNGKKK